MIGALLAVAIASGNSIPSAVQQAGPYIARIAHVKSFPHGAIPWPLADPGAPFNDSDVRSPGLPDRGLILGGCSADVCVLHFEIGGIISPYCILALRHDNDTWRAVWYARLPRALQSFEELQALLEGGSPINLTDMSWCR